MTSVAWYSSTMPAYFLWDFVIQWSCRIAKYLLPTWMFPIARLKYCAQYWHIGAYKDSRTRNSWKILVLHVYWSFTHLKLHTSVGKFRLCEAMRSYIGHWWREVILTVNININCCSFYIYHGSIKLCSTYFECI